ncbi:arabinofuranosidase [Gordonia rubripertincta]|uniref:Arabinofuranosidase n=2 Tax=Gordonia rubripertincta TaxID=36822 RepID=A0AAW6RHM5_GORRU|nr:arabinofuranosidase [Gordonia rubripertincta]MDG6783216.1 arabinofuranosidase [Gordonia rubripertincta]NKY63001.1 glycoside hydrolase family 43 protein [Gordonia rubripertincta]QMU20099.1 arabinofuranosidase [Gordonia rubripertincta]
MMLSQRSRTRSSRIGAVSVAMLVFAGLLVATAGTAEAVPNWRYTMVAFSNTSSRHMDVYQSTDASRFRPLRFGAYRPPSGVVRDPSIFHGADGWYYVAYTTGQNTIGFARSRDRVNWAFMHDYPVPLCCAFLPGTGDGKGVFGSSSGSLSFGSAGSSDGPSLSPFTTKAWAPEFFVEGGRVNIILSMSTGGGFVPYVMTALEPGLRLWSPPIPILSLGADHIDTTVVKVGSTYHAFTKNETRKVIEHAVAKSLTGPYRFVPMRSFGRFVEGMALVKLPNGNWRMYVDAYKQRRYFYSDSGDGLWSWSSAKELPGLSGSVRHFGVIREPA